MMSHTYILSLVKDSNSIQYKSGEHYYDESPC